MPHSISLDRLASSSLLRATRLTPQSSTPRAVIGSYWVALAAGKIDVMTGYCSGAKSRLSQMPELQVAEVPREIAAGPEYGLAILKGANPKAADLALFILSPDGNRSFPVTDFLRSGCRRRSAEHFWINRI
jgi:hypothetical protein